MQFGFVRFTRCISDAFAFGLWAFVGLHLLREQPPGVPRASDWQLKLQPARVPSDETPHKNQLPKKINDPILNKVINLNMDIGYRNAFCSGRFHLYRRIFTWSPPTTHWSWFGLRSRRLGMVFFTNVFPINSRGWTVMTSSYFESLDPYPTRAQGHMMFAHFLTRKLQG